MKIKKLFSWIHHRKIFEVIGISGVFLITLILIFSHPYRFFEPDELCYYFSARNMAEGKWFVSSQELTIQKQEARKKTSLWPHDLGYVPLKDNYVLVKAPGYSVYLAFLNILNLLPLGNVLLVFCCVALGSFLCLQLFRPGTALVSIILLLFSPISMIMIYRLYMSDYAAAAFLFIGGGSILVLNCYHHLPKFMDDHGLNFLAGLFLGMALVMRYTNGISVLFLICAHIYFTLSHARFSSWSGLLRVSFVALGFMIPLCGLAFYNHYVFGRILATGYQLQAMRPQDTTFIFQQIARGYYGNVIETILRNCTVLPEILLSGIPWIILLPPALVWGWKNVERKLYILCAGWIAGILVVFLQYRMLMPHNFVIISRMYLPLIGPAALLVAVYCQHLGSRFSLILCTFTVFICLIYFAFFMYLIHVPFLGIDLTSYFGPIQDVLSVYHPLTNE